MKVDAKLFEQVIELAKQAGLAIMPFYRQSADQLKATTKSDQSPVTQADIAAHNVIVNGLKQLTPDWPVLSEEDKETASYEERKQWQRYWLIDPLDGTRGFIAGLPGFSVNIALIENNMAIAGVIYGPVEQEMYYAVLGGHAYKQIIDQAAQRIQCRVIDWQQITVATGHFHNPKRLATLLADRIPYKRLALNSSLKFCRLAEGLADVYPRFGPTSEWDTAAGQCILEAAGGCVVDLSGQSMQYNAKSSLENSAFVAISDPSAQRRILDLLKRSL